MKERTRLKFKGRHYSVKAFVSLGLGITSLAGYIIMTAVSEKSAGQAGPAVGMAGVIMAILAIAGFVLGLRSLKERDIFYSFSYAGISLSGIALIIYLVSYIVGLL